MRRISFILLRRAADVPVYAAAPPTFRYNAVILSFAWRGRVYGRRGTDMQICKRFRRFYPQAHVMCRYFLATNERRLAHCYTASTCYVPIFLGNGRTSFSSLLYRKRMLRADISWSRAGFIVVREPTSEAVLGQAAVLPSERHARMRNAFRANLS